MDTTFKLDTSGAVDTGNATTWPNCKHIMEWSDLSPFTQGYVEAMLAEYQARVHGDANAALAFSDLATETLATILKDCEAWQAGFVGSALQPHDARLGGVFWRGRGQKGARDFPPLAPYLSDDGKVHLREGV